MFKEMVRQARIIRLRAKIERMNLRRERIRERQMRMKAKIIELSSKRPAIAGGGATIAPSTIKSEM